MFVILFVGFFYLFVVVLQSNSHDLGSGSRCHLLLQAEVPKTTLRLGTLLVFFCAINVRMLLSAVIAMSLITQTAVGKMAVVRTFRHQQQDWSSYKVHYGMGCHDALRGACDTPGGPEKPGGPDPGVQQEHWHEPTGQNRS